MNTSPTPPPWECMDCEASDERAQSATQHQIDTMHAIVPRKVQS